MRPVMSPFKTHPFFVKKTDVFQPINGNVDCHSLVWQKYIIDIYDAANADGVSDGAGTAAVCRASLTSGRRHAFLLSIAAFAPPIGRGRGEITAAFECKQ